MMRTLLVLLVLLAGVSCADAPVAVSRETAVTVSVVAPAAARSLVLEVRAPDIEPALILNIPLGSDSIARTTVTVPAGSGRRFTVTAIDSLGIITHRADTTVAFSGGATTPLQMWLLPLSAQLGLTVTVGGVRLTVPDTSTRLVDWAPIRITASAVDATGTAVPDDSLRWATSQPAVVEVQRGRLVARRLGEAVVVVSYRGASVRVPVRVVLVPDPPAIEEIVAGFYNRFYNGVQNNGVNLQAKMMSQEATGAVANFGIELRARIPREPIGNSPGVLNQPDIYADWSRLTSLLASAMASVGSVDSYRARGASSGSAARDARIRAVSLFAQGLAIGALALAYDSVAVPAPDDPALTRGPFLGPGTAMERALRLLDSAAVVISAPDVAGHPDAVIPGAWVAGANLPPGEFVRLIRSYKARYRAGSARSPAERAAVDWQAVLADVEAGLQSDHRLMLGTDVSLGTWSGGYDASQANVSGGWHAVSLLYSGMADVSGAYQAWVAAPQNFTGISVLIQTPDTRWPRGASRAEQTANSPLPLPVGQYIANRPPGNDVVLSNSTFSAYDHRRWYPIFINGGVGTYVFMAFQELAMLRAEGLLRTGNAAAAMALVNASRTAHGLPAFTDAAGVAPGGNACVPKLPSGICGALLEAMKYEKRMETQMLGQLQWFTDSRGWGDLVRGTPVHFPVPYQEMQLRGRTPYDMPSMGTLPGAPVGTYGF